MARHAMIMAGGAGTRLWPMSRADRPKQLLRFVRGADGEPTSLLELSAARLEGLVPADRRFVCTGEVFRRVILETVTGITDDRILGEPVGRDTVNAVGFAAAVLAKQDPDAVFCVLTADHIIEPEDTFRARVDLGFSLVEQDPSRLVTFGIKPTHAATGFGYIERGNGLRASPDGREDDAKRYAFEVARFVEKPDAARAQAYFESGQFFWNAGMFVFHAATFLDLLDRHAPESGAGLRKIGEAWGTGTQRSVLEEVYPTLPKISVDYAVMEPASSDPSVTIVGVETDVRWLDVGSWPSFGETLEGDADGNRVSGGAGTTIMGGRDNLVVSEDTSGHHIALLGVDDLIVVQTRDATLVMPRSRAQELKDLHATLDPKLR